MKRSPDTSPQILLHLSLSVLFTLNIVQIFNISNEIYKNFISFSACRLLSSRNLPP